MLELRRKKELRKGRSKKMKNNLLCSMQNERLNLLFPLFRKSQGK